MQEVMINPSIYMMSLVGVHGKFPFSHGNYCSIQDRQHGIIYMANIWAENLRHVLSKDALRSQGGKMKIALFEQNGIKYGMCIDPLVPKVALHEPYFCSVQVCVELLRWYYGVEGECLCSDMTKFTKPMLGGSQSWHYLKDAKGKVLIDKSTGSSILSHVVSCCAQCNSPIILANGKFIKVEV